MGRLFGRGGRRNGTPARSPIRSRPALKALGSRLVPAGNVSASLVLGDLALTDTGSVGLTISQPAADQITLTPDKGATINGQAGGVRGT